ncbi:hypothetical protein A2291_07100 [candidate division WOR-1 bacterium RIFOXYB2_FULL_42_35]|uniref:Rod shape-determining protein MreD n=1 Tax=candidate division WOR-1 bacterium RIFOXYC2_FULL_41_25 TaxID=1802586 RepID=A0A1F4TKG3_UNCSA|nr:MAG: hypothetical protein A2247_04440 [candidate division WOR-1 bacterium RIFOXYA2_FULL_41_14]OGC22474.1 MAG: hypothetical protein A2291_07100 [candidate division WOR-1 bacterium RIFOXYB2_FULL_42_35]OGC33212.1 MAG: hypothetical protein A2462_07275 [candidate division WOR-1 bacterium RIFOXYC2_FULL_41_25]
MRILKLALYILAILLLQTVVFARLNLFGVCPDLVFVSVIVFAVLNKGRRVVLFALPASLLQDVLSLGIYLHTIFNLFVCVILSVVGDGFEGNEFLFAAGFVALFTPVIFLLQYGVLAFVFGRQFSLLQLLVGFFLLEFYNLLVFPLVFMVLRKLSYE